MNIQKRLILVVDDEADFRRAFRYHFEDDLGYEVAEAANGEEALRTVAERAADVGVVITDIRMPKMDGEELIRRLQAERPSLPIIGITGHADLKDQLSALGQGAYYYLNKPLDPWPVIERLIHNAIRVYEVELENQHKRQREQEVARLVRAYILRNAVQRDGLASTDPQRRLALDIRVEPVEISEPGGDFVEWFERDGSEMVFYVADAAGHGDVVPCFLACLSSMILHRSHHGRTPPVEEMILIVDEVLQELRRAGALDAKHYLTFFMGGIDLCGRELAYVNAGHIDAFLVRPPAADGGETECLRLTSHCPPVGFPLPRKSAIERVEVRPGDLVFVFTDGASEHLAQGVDELERVVKPLVTKTADAVVQEVATYLAAHFGAHGPKDDTTLMAIKILEATAQEPAASA